MESMLSVSISFRHDDQSLLLVIFHLKPEEPVEDYPEIKIRKTMIPEEDLTDSMFQLIMVFKRHPEISDTTDLNNIIRKLHDTNMPSQLIDKVVEMVRVILSADVSNMPNEPSVLIIQTKELSLMELQRTIEILQQVSIPANLVRIAGEVLRTLRGIDLTTIPTEAMVVTVQTSNFRTVIERSLMNMTEKLGAMQDVTPGLLETMFMVMQLLQISVWIGSRSGSMMCEGNICNEHQRPPNTESDAPNSTQKPPDPSL